MECSGDRVAPLHPPVADDTRKRNELVSAPHDVKYIS